MSTKFLEAFSRGLVQRLVAEGHLELEAGGCVDDVVRHVAEAMGGQASRRSLISTLSKALLTCPAVAELYVGDEGLQDLVNNLSPTVLPR